MKKNIKYTAVIGIAAAAVITGAAVGITAPEIKSEAATWLDNDLGNYTPSTSIIGSSSGYDFSVWANGRDIKDDKKTPQNEERRYKTGTKQHIAMSTGGKWNAVVTSTSVTSVDDFMRMIDAKGKFTDPAAAENKQIASAKIKDGEIVLSAGKKAGNVHVWVYETNKNGLVYLPRYDVMPKMYTAEVKVSAANPILAEPGEIKDGVAQGNAKGVTKLDLIFEKAPGTIQATTSLALGDKKEAPDRASTYSVSYSNGDKTNTASVVSALVSSDKSTVYITPVSVGKTTLLVTNDQSGKSAKLSIEVKNKYAVRFDPRYVTVSDVTNKNETVEIKDGDEIIDGSTVKITAIESAGAVQIMVDGKAVKSGGTAKVTGKVLDIRSGLLYPITVTGDDKSNSVKEGTKSIKSGSSYMVGTKLTLAIEKGGTATVTCGERTDTYIGDGVNTFDFMVLGQTTVAFAKPATPTNP